jgi:hypothetical protein
VSPSVSGERIRCCQRRDRASVAELSKCYDERVAGLLVAFVLERSENGMDHFLALPRSGFPRGE